MKIREKRIYSGKISGKILEAEFYPVTSDGRRYSRGVKKKQSKASQKKLNDKNAKKKLRRLMETNFTEGQDYYCTFTYHDQEQPESYEACKKDLTNFFRRLRRAREKAGLTELKYIYAIECKKIKATGFVRYHIHMVLNGGLPRRQIKELWGKGIKRSVEELQADERGFERLANYICKEWRASRSTQALHAFPQSQTAHRKAARRRFQRTFSREALHAVH